MFLNTKMPLTLYSIGEPIHSVKINSSYKKKNTKYKFETTNECICTASVLMPKVSK